jgi:hypothetical protein
MNSITLSQQEIEEITHLKRPAFQVKFLKQLGIEAKMRPDNTVLVMRHNLKPAANDAAIQQPTLKSSRR